jgi:hypothetical protein
MRLDGGCTGVCQSKANLCWPCLAVSWRLLALSSASSDRWRWDLVDGEGGLCEENVRNIPEILVFLSELGLPPLHLWV